MMILELILLLSGAMIGIALVAGIFALVMGKFLSDE